MKRTILAAMVLSLALSGCNTAYNYFEDDDEGAPTPAGGFNLAHSLMKHTGVVPKDTQRIAYKPRAPLAMPGTDELPAPEARDENNTAEAAVNFPVDHDVQEENRKSELANALAKGQALPTSTGNSGTTTRQGLALPTEAVSAEQRESKKVSFQDPSPVRSLKEMRKRLDFRAPQETLLTEDGKAAPRKYLIQPPEDYRTPAETAALPEKGDIENSEWLDKQLYRDVKSGNRPAYIAN